MLDQTHRERIIQMVSDYLEEPMDPDHLQIEESGDDVIVVVETPDDDPISMEYGLHYTMKYPSLRLVVRGDEVVECKNLPHPLAPTDEEIKKVLEETRDLETDVE